ncbi:protein ZGRF1 isoform X2 [Ochotona princeps]|uniref:protein ZGRF1 isoform X2 n=1 Tax=Ochotona princeps TaxID=9978 RepID=UPI0027153902|nr:protein ZGRF1 isoform X2 [Ochotona princeps]
MVHQEFIVLYTHQKTKKSKVWQDGILKIPHLGNKATLYDDKGSCLESLFLKCFEVKPGDDLESDRYLITVEEVKVSGSTAVKEDVVKETPEARRFMSSGWSLGCQPSGLKRKFTDFKAPRQVPKKMVIPENGESAMLIEDQRPGPTFVPPSYSIPPLFPTIGKKDVNTIPTNLENALSYETRERSSMSSVAFTPGFKINSEMLCEKNYFCSESNHSDPSLTNEPMKRDNLASQCSGGTQAVRSKAQILALLKSKSTNRCKEFNSEGAEHFPEVQPQDSLKIPIKPKCFSLQEEYAEMKSKGNSNSKYPLENTMRTESRWAMYLSVPNSPAHSLMKDASDTEVDVNMNVKELLSPKEVDVFETSTEKDKKHSEDKTVGSSHQSWNQEVKLEIPSLPESNSLLLVSCRRAENDGLLSKSEIQDRNKIPFRQNDKEYLRQSVCTTEHAHVANACEALEEKCERPVSFLPDSEHLPTKSFLNSNSGISDDIRDTFSKSHADRGHLNSICEQPFLEINFNLNNFEISDTEDESQESSKVLQNSESGKREILINDGNSCVQKRCKDISHKEMGSEHLPLLTSIGGKPEETSAIEEILPSWFLGEACVDFDTGPCKAENTEKGLEEECSDTLSNFDSSLEWTDDVYLHNKKDAKKSLRKVRISHDFPLFPNEAKNTNMITNQTSESGSLFPENVPPQPSILGIDLDKNDKQVFPTTSSTDSNIQLLNANHNHSGSIELDKTNTQDSSSSFYSLDKKHPVPADTKVYVPEPRPLGKLRSLPNDYNEVEAARRSAQHGGNPRNSLELSGLVNSISLLKSLSEYSTALDSLEILKNNSTALQQQGIQQTREPDRSPKARKPSVTVTPQAVLRSPHWNQDSQQVLEPNEALQSPNEALQSLPPVEFQGHQVKGSAAGDVMARGSISQLDSRQFPRSTGYENSVRNTCFFMPRLPSACMQNDFSQFPKGNFPKGSTIFNIEGNLKIIAESEKDSIENNCFLTNESEHSYNFLNYDCKSAEKTLCEANKVTSSEHALSPVSTFSLNTRDEDFMLEFSKESLKARTFPGMKKASPLQTVNIQRLPLVSRTRVPLITLLPANGPTESDSYSYVPGCNTHESSVSPFFDSCEESVVPCSFGLGDKSEISFSEESREMTPWDVLLLDNKLTQSKWLKYQNISQYNLTIPERADQKVTDGFVAEAGSGLHFSDTDEMQSDAVDDISLDSVHLQMMKSMLYQEQQDVNSRDLVSRKTVLSLNLKQTSRTEEIQNMLGGSACFNYSVKDFQEINDSELCFPSGQKIKSAYLPQRKIHIPAVFQSPAHYKQIFTSSIIEHLNILLFEMAYRLHKALSKVDISFYTSSKGEKLKNLDNNIPSCHHNQPAKLVMVKKEGPNKGRLFYTCDGPKANQCKFFKWLEEVDPGVSTHEKSKSNLVLNDIKSIGVFLRSQKIPLYEECQLLVRKGFDFERKHGKLKKLTTVNPDFYNESKSRLYLKLSRKESSSVYSKDDLWVVSKTLDFEQDTFIACSAFFGPSSLKEVELLPLKGYFPSNWPTNIMVHALLVCNASTELTTLKNIQDYFNPATLPISQYLLTMSPSTTVSNKRINKRRFIPPAFAGINTKFELLSQGATLQLAHELIQVHRLNEDQATALLQIAQMMSSHEILEEVKEVRSHTLPITIIHGVFGAGKSYLLAVVILFFVQLFEKSEIPTVGNARPWKLLISSSTNVAVDRVLLGLLDLGFEKFVRVGSIRKIAKPILPYSLHAGSENENEQLKELLALMKEDLTPVEKVYVRKSIEQHKLGTNRKLLKQVRVVGITCAACPFPCMNDLKFPVVVLDECSQITEPASLLPIARFECEKLILVGDPKQLPPTIQGSEAAHANGLEQTLFDRLCLMGHKSIMLRTQYRCHPAISAIANDLFYEGNLMNGISDTERSPLLGWLPTLCFYNVKGLEQIEGDNSFHNVAEASFTLKLIQSLIASGIVGSMIGVITLYKSQMYKLCHLLNAVDFAHPNIKAVQVSTVDAFQGAEKEIIILSCVRTRQVGFIDSEKRMNVALTRGRRHLLIVGNLACLRKNRLWSRVIQHCEGRKDGLQHATQCEPHLNHLLKDYFEKQAAEKQKKSEKEKFNEKSQS